MKMKKTLLLFVSVLGIAFQVQAGPWDELNQLNEKYAKATSYYTRIRYTLMDADNPSTLIDDRNGEVKRSPLGLYNKLDQLEYVVNKTYALLINHDLQECVVQRNTAMENPNSEGTDYTWINTLLKQNNVMYYVTADVQGQKAFRIDFKHNVMLKYRYIDIHFSAEKLEVTKVKMFYRHDASLYGLEGAYTPLMVMEYSSQNFAPVFTENDFSEKNYVSINGNKAQGVNSCKDYSILLDIAEKK